MTKLQASLIDAMGWGIRYTTAELAEKVGKTPRGVSNSLCFLRGEGLVKSVNEDGTYHLMGSGPIYWERSKPTAAQWPVKVILTSDLA